MVGEIDFGALRSPDYFGNALRGQQAAQQQNQQNALRDGGQLLGSGDPGAAAQVYGSAGLTDEARAANSDVAEAAKQRAETAIHVATSLENVPEGQRKAALQSAYPLFQAAHIDTSHFDGLTEEQLSTPSLRAFTGDVAKEVEQYTLTPGAQRYDARGKLIAEAPRAPEKPVVVGNGATAIDPATGRPIYSNPKTFAPPRPKAAAAGDATPAGSVPPWERKW